MKVIVGMSGGVDSAVSAYLLKKQGYEVIGIFMRNWDSYTNNDILGNPNVDSAICTEEAEWNDVKTLGKQIGIEVKRVDFVKEYWDNVFEDLIYQYKNGRTPNPDILCNKYIKFGTFYKWVFENIPNVDFIATGHYAKIENFILKKPKDSWKDQTYFLSQINKKALTKTIFPLADLEKEEVRKIASENNLIVANKKDSTGICFIGKRNFSQFLQNYIPNKPGNIVSIIDNKILGKHVGTMYYTIGQRKGLNLGGMKEPHYVCGYDLKERIIYVAPESNKSFLLSDKAIIKNINWFNKKEDMNNIEVKFRYNSKQIKCSIRWIDETTVEVIYEEGFEAVTLGQQAVFYNGNICLGGGFIDKIFYKKNKLNYMK